MCSVRHYLHSLFFIVSDFLEMWICGENLLYVLGSLEE